MKWIKSMSAALNGIGLVIRNERNFRIQLAIGALVLAGAAYLQFSRGDWIKILLCMMFVLALETMNSAIEKTLDKFHPAHDAEIGKIKDMAAGAVLIAAIFAFVAGVLIFWRYLF